MSMLNSDLKNLYDKYDDGLGGSYERIALFFVLDHLVHKYNVKKILELNATFICGVPAFSGALLALAGYDVTIMVHSRDHKQALSIWREAGLLDKVNIVEGNNDFNTPFLDNEFDLVWNHLVIEQYDKPDPQRLLWEMKRVSSNLIFTSTLNPHTLGYGMHFFFHKISFFFVLI